MAFNTQFWTWMSGWNQTFGGTGGTASFKKQDDDTYNPRYPWFNRENYEKLERKVSELWLTWSEKQEVMDEFYRQILPQVEEEKKKAQRNEVLNQQKYEISQITDDVQRKVANHTYTVEELAQKVKEKENLREDAPDAEVFNTWINSIPNWEELLGNYMNKWDKELLYVWWLAERPKKSFWDKVEEFAVWVAQSPWKRGYNMIWQWADKIGKWAGEWLANLMSDEQKQGFIDFLDKNNLLSREEIETYWSELQKQKDEWTTFNGREQTDIRTPILWEERANSKNVKAWEVVWDIVTGIAATAPIWAALAPTIAWSSIWGAAWIWALEWIADTAITQYGSQWDLNASAWQRVLWAVWGAAWWLLTKYLASLPPKQLKDIKKEATWYIEKSIKPTVKGKQSQVAYDKFIDDALDVTDYMSKNKQVIKYTDDAWDVITGELPRNLRETSEALSNMKKYIYDQYNSIAQKAWDAWAKVNLNKLYDKLDDLANNNSVNLANPWLKNAIESYKNQLLQYSDDLGNITIQEAQDTMQYYNKILDAYFRNPWAMATDTSKNIVVANLKRWLADAVDDSMDDVLNAWINNWSTASQQYKDRKLLYSKIKTIEDEVSKRALVEARKNTKWLSTDIIDALAWGNLVEWLLTQNPTWLLKWAVMKWINAYNKYLNSPNTQIRNLFNLVDKVNNPSIWRASLANNIQNIAQNAWIEWVSAPNLLWMAWGTTTAAWNTVWNVLSNNE